MDNLLMLDYEVVPVDGDEAIDFLGFHILNQVNDWLFVGLGGHVPLVEGSYGGTMTFDFTVHAQKSLYRNLFIDAGVSFGGGGGGRDREHSQGFTGSGGFVKEYIGLGYDFREFSAGINYSDLHFTGSAIDHAQVNLFVQIPFSFSVGPYGQVGQLSLSPRKSDEAGLLSRFGENIQSIGVEYITQLHAKGSNTDPFSVLELQFSHFVAKDTYVYVEGGVGIQGLSLYNQLFTGFGQRITTDAGVTLYGQLGVGSAGYSPDIIDTGPGLFVYPKLVIEYAIHERLGLAISGGYLFAPLASSENVAVGASLNYHPYFYQQGSHAASDAVAFRDHRLHFLFRSDTDVRSGQNDGDRVDALSFQYDTTITKHWYIPAQVSISVSDFFGYPGSGSIFTGLGVQSDSARRIQVFAQTLIGANALGAMVKPEIGVNYGLTDHLAVIAQAGRVFSMESDRFSANSFALGMTYRYSRP